MPPQQNTIDLVKQYTIFGDGGILLKKTVDKNNTHIMITTQNNLVLD